MIVINHKYGDEYNKKLWDRISEYTDEYCPCDYCNFADCEDIDYTQIYSRVGSNFLSRIVEHETDGGCHACKEHDGVSALFEWNGELWFN